MNTALLIIDMQHDFVLPGAPLCVAGATASVQNIANATADARRHGYDIIHVVRSHAADGSDAEPARRHLFTNGTGYCVAGMDGSRIVDALTPLEGDYIVKKKRFSAFFKTELDRVINEKGITRLLIAGTQYPNCIRATAVDALNRDLEVVVLTDCCSAQTDEVAASNIADMSAMGIECMTANQYFSNIR